MDILKLFLIGMLAISLAYYVSRPDEKREDNLALRLKKNTEATQKRKAVSWKNLEDKIAESTATNPVNALVSKQERRVQDSDTSILAKNIQASMKDHSSLTKQDVNANLEAVEELISRNANVYSAYKAKLILMLSKENIEGQSIDEEELQDLLLTMSQFDVLSDDTIKKEAFLIAGAGSRIDQLNDEVEEYEELMADAQSEEEVSEIEFEIEQRLSEVESIENQLNEGLLDDEDFLNQDVVEIPLMRYLAQNNFERVFEESENLLESYPSYVSGHFFYIRALQLSGRKQEAYDYISQLNLDETRLANLKARLDFEEEQSPSDYWKNLQFQ